jgi:hypothetical protein
VPVFAGTKRNSRTARSVRPAVPQPHFPRFVGFFVGTKRHRHSHPRITPLCALRFCAVTACVYVSIVTRLEACLSSSCMTLMSALFARRRVEYVCRLCTQRHSRHYLPFLTMSSDREGSWRSFNNCRSQRESSRSITRHSFLRFRRPPPSRGK